MSDEAKAARDAVVIARFQTARREQARASVSKVMADMTAMLAREPRDAHRRYHALDGLYAAYDLPHKHAMREAMMLLIAEAQG
jgi:hypothetical protein